MPVRVARATLQTMENVPPPAEELAILDRELVQLDARRAQLLARRAWLLAALRPPVAPPTGRRPSAARPFVARPRSRPRPPRRVCRICCSPSAAFC